MKGDNSKDYKLIEKSLNNEVEKTFWIKAKNGKFLNQIYLEPLNDRDYVFNGEYFNEEYSLGSHGIYFGFINDYKVKCITYRDYLSFDDFLKFFPEKEKKRIEKEKMKLKERKKELNIDFHVVEHKVLKFNGKFILISEVYREIYGAESYNSASQGGKGSNTVSYMKHGGNHYTHALIICFDKQAKIIWNKVIELDVEENSTSSKKISSVYLSDSLELKIAFSSKNILKTITLNSEGEITEKHETQIMDDIYQSIEEQFNKCYIEYWYKENFLVSGARKVGSIKGISPDKRKIFFINKFKF